MKKPATILSMCLMAMYAIAQPCREVVGYYPGWQWYDRAHLVQPATIDYSKYSIINFAFFAPQADGSIQGTDAWSDEILLQGEIDWVNGGHFPNTSLVDLAHQANVKVLISVGGWTLSNHFPAIAADAQLRAIFAHHCVLLCDTYKLDGIDIDWEYPGYAPHSGTNADQSNYTLFLQQVRDSLDEYGLQHSQTMLLTAAVGASHANMANVEWNSVSGILDIINLMSYDYFGAWDATTNHNAPLHAPAQGDATFNLDSSVNYLVNHYQVPAAKITCGVAFYGRSVQTQNTPGLFAASTGIPDNITFQEDDGSPLYYNILNKMNLFTSSWDAQSEVPFLIGNGGLQTFVSYDDEQSIALKAQYIVDHQLRGAIIWEITGDYLETAPGSGVLAGTPLADTLNSVFCNSTVDVHPVSKDFFTVRVYPNPSTGNVHVKFMGVVSGFEIYNVSGQIVYEKKPDSFFMPDTDIKITVPGIYYLKATGQGRMTGIKFCITG